MYWGVFGGIRLWGDHLFKLVGLGEMLGVQSRLDGILIHRISLLNICLMAGATSAALISRQFHINRPPPLEYVWAVIGGSLMGLGATLAGFQPASIPARCL